MYLWENNESRNKIIQKYFHKLDTPQGLISSDGFELPKVNIVSYSKLFKNKDSALSYEFELINQIHQLNKSLMPTRLAGDDCTLWFKQGLTQQFLEFEQKINKYFMKNKISCICCYNINEIQDNETLIEILKSHELVLLDKPHSLFRRQT